MNRWRIDLDYMVKEPYSLSFKNIPLDASILSCHIVAERNAGMIQVGKIKRLISHKLVAGKRIPGSQFAVQRFHHLEIVISQILDGKNTAGLPVSLTRSFTTRASAISLLLIKNRLEATASLLSTNAFQLGYPTMRESNSRLNLLGLQEHATYPHRRFSVLTETVSWV